MGKKTANPNKILSTKTVLMYGLGILGLQAGIGLVNSYQAEFFNKMLGANLMIVAAIILGAKFISIIADFIIGNLIDRSKFKSGKMRPWIFISAFPFVVLTMIMFVTIPFSSDAGKYIYILFITVLWNVSMSLADIPSQGMLALLSPNAEERNGAAGIANIMKSAGLACPGVFATVVCMLTGSGEVGKNEYMILAGIISGLGVILYLLIYFFCKENVRSTASSSMTFKQMFKELKGNKMILIVLFTFLLGFGRNIGLGIAVQASIIFLREGVNIPFLGIAGATGDAVSWLIGLTCAATSMVSILFVPAINKRWGEKKTFIVFGIYGFVVSLTVFLMYALGAAALRSLGAILIYQVFIGFMFGPHGYLPMVMTSDIVDYQEWKTGKRTEGAQFAILSMSNKISNALSVAFAIFMVGAIGYSSEQYFSAFTADSANITSYVTNSMQTNLAAIYFLVPGICCVLSMIPMFWYKIDGPTKLKMRADLAQRRAQAAEGVSELAFEAGIEGSLGDSLIGVDEMTAGTQYTDGSADETAFDKKED